MRGGRPAPVRRAVHLLMALFLTAPGVAAQAQSGRAAIDALVFPPLDFTQPVVDQRDVLGVPVLVLESRELPLVTVHAYFKGGYGLFGRESYASAMGLPALMRYGGTTTLTPDSVDEALDYYAIQTSFGSASGSVTSSVNTLTEHLDVAIDLWVDLLTAPRFDLDEVEIWRGRQLESVLRRQDNPSRLAFSEFNRLLYGDHPIGWEMEVTDLDRVTPESFRRVHERVICRDNLVLGITGDVSRATAEDLATRLVGRIPPCPAELPEAPIPDILRSAGVYLIEKDLEQAVIVMAHPTNVRLEDAPEFYSAMIGNSILGAGGFSSRILARVRTEEGYAYSASSLWTTPRKHEGIVGAITRTRPENAVPAIDVILSTMEELRAQPPTDQEVRTAVDRIVNGFVFNFSTSSQIVSRTMFYLAQDLPQDWLERYLNGVQKVTPSSVRETFAEHLRPDDMTILIVGDPERIGWDALRRLGPVTVLDIG